MSYIEDKNLRVVSEDGNTITTTVKFDCLEKPIKVPHFIPNMDPSDIEDYITLGLNNRDITEQKKLGLLPPDPEPEPIIE